MRVAVSSLGPTLEDRVDERFGRAAYLLAVDVETLAVDVIDNSANQQTLQGAGPGAVEAVAEARCDAVITGHLGPKAFYALEAIRVPGYAGAGMTVGEAIDAFCEGSLELLPRSDSHQGLE